MQTLANKTEVIPESKLDPRSGKYLVFGLGREEFGIRVLSVREIMGVQDITAVPHTAAHIRGVINLRGKVIPVVDLRLKFGIQAVKEDHRTCIVVVQAGGGQAGKDGAPLLIGVIVDCVVEVLNLAAGDIEDTPDFGHGATLPYLLGMAKVKDKVKILLDIDEVIAANELRTLSELIP